MPRTPAPLTVVRIVGEGWHVRKGDNIVAVFYSAADARAFVALPALIAALQELADCTICDDEPDQCSQGPGPYCDRHYFNEDFVPIARAALAALAQADGPKEQP